MTRKNIITTLTCLLLSMTAMAQSAANITTLRKQANAGNVKSQVELANRLLSGKGVKSNFTEATQWFRKAADKGNIEAQFNLKP